MGSSCETQAQLTKVTASYVSDSAGVLPLWIAKETGIFARNGLDVQAVRVHAAVGVMARELQFDVRFIKELDESGYVDSLYRSKGR